MSRNRIDLRPREWLTLTRLQAILDKCTVTSEGCWEWGGSRNVTGYGIVAIPPRGKSATAHRVLYSALVGYVPPDLDLDHLCRNRACVNPEHLEPVTHRENCQRGTRGELLRTRAAERTHCANGHELNDENVRITKQGWRDCRPCNTERARRYRQAVA